MMMSYKERLARLEAILQIDRLSSSSPRKHNNDTSNVAQQQCDNNINKNYPKSNGGGGGGGGDDGESVQQLQQQQHDGDGSSSRNDEYYNDSKIDLNELKQLVFHGLPGDNKHRPLVWRLLLNYLPPNSLNSWHEHLAKKRSNYYRFVEELLILDEGGGGGRSNNSNNGNGTTSSIMDHPLNPEPDSKWQMFFKDNDVLLQIDKDVRRLCPEMSFFQSPTPYPNKHIISGRMERLHKRVHSSVLQSTSVIRKGLGVTKMMMMTNNKEGSGGNYGNSNNIIRFNSSSNNSQDDELEQSAGGMSEQTMTAVVSNSSSSERHDDHTNCKLVTTTTTKSLQQQQQQQQQQLVSEETTRAVVVVVEEECHWEVVERILFLYAKLNPGQSYVQGMNEIIGPIYYTLANDQQQQQSGSGSSSDGYKWREHAEPDTFYLFTNLMGEIRDFFIRSLDQSVSGIGRIMEVLMGRLEGRDPDVFRRVVGELEIVPQYYAFRWITLLMSQEFPLPDVLRIWDTLLSDPNRFDFLIDLACAMIIHIRSDLLTGDFPTNMKLLQNYPPIDVRDILRLASSYREHHGQGNPDDATTRTTITGGGGVGDIGQKVQQTRVGVVLEEEEENDDRKAIGNSVSSDGDDEDDIDE